MKRADIKIGYLCNNHCLFCVQGKNRELYGNKSCAEIKKAINLARKTCQDLVFTGGEATLRNDFLELVSYAKKLGFRNIQIQSNGRMFSYVDFCIKTIAAGATEFALALHGHNSKLHDKLTGAKGSFDQTTTGIKNLKKLKQRVVTNTVVNKKNYKYLPEIAELLASLKVDQYQFAFVHITGSAMENREIIVPRKKAIMPYIFAGLDKGIKAGITVMTEAIPFCLMQGYEAYVAERIIPDSMVIEYTRITNDYKQYRINEGKEKIKECQKCIYFKECEGPWREYPQLYGWKEFKPIKAITK